MNNDIKCQNKQFSIYNKFGYIALFNILNILLYCLKLYYQPSCNVDINIMNASHYYAYCLNRIDNFCNQQLYSYEYKYGLFTLYITYCIILISSFKSSISKYKMKASLIITLLHIMALILLIKPVLLLIFTINSIIYSEQFRLYYIYFLPHGIVYIIYGMKLTKKYIHHNNPDDTSMYLTNSKLIDERTYNSNSHSISSNDKEKIITYLIASSFAVIIILINIVIIEILIRYFGHKESCIIILNDSGMEPPGIYTYLYNMLYFIVLIYIYTAVIKYMHILIAKKINKNKKITP